MNPDRFRFALLVLLVVVAAYGAIATRYTIEAQGGGGAVRFDRWTGKAYLVGPGVELELRAR